MKATEAKVLEFIRKSPQFIIPIYQRNYSWTEEHCRQLWDDIVRAGSNESISAHFVGSIVYVEKGMYQVSSQSPLLVIDGQQRLTSISLLLIALLETLDDQEPVDGFSARKVRNYYLINPEEDGEKSYKLLLSQSDKATLLHLLGAPAPAEKSLRIEENFAFFKERLRERQQDLATICKGLLKLMVVDVALDRQQDNPQLIFESMNSTGAQLSQADLIRNFILMGLEPEEQTDLYQRYWRPMELGFGQEAYNQRFDGFMRHYLTLKTGELPRFDAVYKAFKNYARRPDVLPQGMEGLVRDLHIYAGYYCAMALGRENNARLAKAFHELRELKVDVAYPLLLELYHDFATGVLPVADFEEAVRLIESYVFRRAACAIPTNSLQTNFMTLSRALKKDRYLESFKAGLLLLPSYRRFPSNEEFKRELQVRNLYTNRLRGYWPYKMENHTRKERVTIDGYTVEHIMPQNPNLCPEWQANLGPEWQQVQERWLHTLGNLTLTAYNPEYSDRPFREKRDHAEYGFKTSPLFLNQALGAQQTWNEEAILERATRLAEKATVVWPAPTLPADIINAYKKKPEVSSYSLEDHPNLLTSPGKELFQAFRAAVLAIDPCVTETILKLYVAFKANTNFVDVVPQANRIRLSLNMQFHEIEDPRNMCRNVSSIGRWGNGDVEVGFTTLEDFPYIMGLVRQAFDKQMGNGEDE